jgi:hypothetical protein
VKVYDYLGADGTNEIKAWLQGLDKRSRARVNQKIDMIERADIDALPGLLHGNKIQGEAHIAKLKIGGSGTGRALRPLVCRGPIDNNAEITILLGAEEKDGKLPAGAGKEAGKRRAAVVATPTQRRCDHERVS